LRESLKEDDNLLIYFAGHGEIDPAKEGYWLPVDAQANAPSSWISNRAVSDILNMMSAKHVLVVADSCYSGSMPRASVPASSFAQEPQYAPIKFAGHEAGEFFFVPASGGVTAVQSGS